VTPPLPFALVPVADLETQEPLAPEFVWDKLVPADTVTLLAAHGGTGKSFVALMLCVAVALGLPLFGLGTRQGKAAFFSGEDGAAMLRYRLRLVCRRMGVQMRDLKDQLFIMDATEHDPRLYVEATGRRGGDVTATFEALRGFVHREGISLVVLDNASDTFDAPEIDRARVRAFMRALTVMARQANAGVLLLAHVDKGTSRGERGPNSEGYSGSTAWHNSARSRLFMHRDKDGALLLEHQKGNLAAGLVPKTRLEWQMNDIPKLAAAATPKDEAAEQCAASAGKSLLKLIDEFNLRGEYISSSTNSRNHAAKLLAKEPNYPKMKNAEVFDVLRSEQRAGHLKVTTYKGLDRKPRERWEVTPEGKSYAGIAASAVSAAGAEHTAPSAPAAEPAASAASALQGVWGKERAHEPAAETC
jgi:putative DNA primase/helicase